MSDSGQPDIGGSRPKAEIERVRLFDEGQLASLDHTEHRLLGDAQFGRLLRNVQESRHRLGGGWLRRRTTEIEVGELIDPAGKGGA
jgi:hypothetical protein